MNISDLRFVCKQVGITYNIKNSKNTLVKKLLSPLKKSYKMNISDPIQASNEIISRIIDGEYDDDLENGRIIAQRYIKQIQNERAKKTINDNLEEVIRNRVRILMFKDRLFLKSLSNRDEWKKYLNPESKIACIIGIQSALNSIVKEYPQIDNEKDRTDIALLLKYYCEFLVLNHHK